MFGNKLFTDCSHDLVRCGDDDRADPPADYGTLEIETTIDDPKVYARPWTVRMDQSIELDTKLIDEFCLENEKSYERMIRSRTPK